MSIPNAFAIGAMNSALETQRNRDAEEADFQAFLAAEASRPKDQPRDNCVRCAVKGSDHAAFGCKRYTPPNYSSTPLMSFNTGSHALG